MMMCKIIKIVFKQLMNQFLKQSALFLLLAGGIYACFITSAIYHQKLYSPLFTLVQNSHDEKYFGESLVFTICPQLIATIIGQIILAFQGQSINLPWKRCVPISAIINFNMFTYNQAVIHASFPAVVMAKSCSLLSVIIIGVFFSRVKDSSLKLTHQKLIIGLVATAGIIMFNFFKQQQQSDDVNQSLTLFSLGNLFLIASLIGDGFLPDFQAQLKVDYKPTTIQMYCMINRFTFIIALILAVVTGRIFVIIDFMLNYQQFFMDILKLSVLNAVGQLFIYKTIKQFRQHIPAFVIAFRKCLTVIVNILWFHHGINLQQILGISLVFLAVMWQVYNSYKQSVSKQVQFQEVKQQEHQSVDIMQMIDQELKNNQQEIITPIQPMKEDKNNQDLLQAAYGGQANQAKQ